MAILYSGVQGTCQWTIDDQGHLYIGNGVINHNTTSLTDWSWYQYRDEITSVSSGNVSWNIGANAYGMFFNFSGTTSFDLSNFDTSNVTNMNSMFFSCVGLTSLDLSNFNTSNVTVMTYMFGDCSSLISLNLSNFDTNKVKAMSYMFEHCDNLTTIMVSDKWTVASVTSSQDMFKNCNSLIGEQETTYDSSHIDASYAHIDEGVSNPGYLTNINSLPCYASFNINAGELKIFRDIEGKYTNEETINDIVYWTGIENRTGTSSPKWRGYNFLIKTVKIVNLFKPKTAYAMFADCRLLTSLNLSNFDTSNVTDMGFMFSGCTSLTSLDLSNFDTSNVTGMNAMFQSCSSLTSLDLSNFDTSNVTNMSYMFNICTLLTSLDLSNFDTNNVTNMNHMFSDCDSLTSINLLSQFNTSNVTNMGYMFRYCKSLTSLDLSNFDTSNVTNMSYMFQSCISLTSLDLSNFDTNNVTDMNRMFQSCILLASINLSSFDTSNVTDMSYIFYGCSRLNNLYITKLFLNSVLNINYGFYNCKQLPSLNLIVSDTALTSTTTSTFYGIVNNFYIIDPTQSNTSWENVARYTNKVFYNVNQISLPVYSLKASRGDVVNNEWKDDEAGVFMRFVIDIGNSSIISNFPDEFTYENTTYTVKENDIEIQGQWQQEGNVYTLILSPSEFDEEKAHQYFMEISYNFSGDDYDPETEGSITYSKKVSQIVSIPQAYALLDFRAGGKGIAVGKFSERNGFDIAFPVSIGEGLQPPETQEFFLSKDTTVDNSKTYYIEQNDEYIVVNNPTGNPIENNYYESRMTVDLNNYQLLIGRYNKTIDNAYFVIGSGENNNQRRNVLELDAGGLRLYDNTGTRQIVAFEYGESTYSAARDIAPYYTLGTRKESAGTYDQTQVYTIGDLCKYNDKIYICDTVIDTPEAWNSNHWSFPIGGYSIAEGEETVAAGTDSHAEGIFCKAISLGSHAEGYNTIAASGSHSEGRDTRAIGTHSHAGGDNTIAQRASQMVIGEYNKPDTGTILIAGSEDSKRNYRGDYSFIIGNGTSNNARSNALTVDWSGNMMTLGMAGMIQMFGGTTPPPGWLLCDGSQVSRTTYAELFAVIGTNYGEGDGSTTFGLPDLRGRFPLGVNTDDLPNGQSSTVNYDREIGDGTGGLEEVTLKEAELPNISGYINLRAVGSGSYPVTSASGHFSITTLSSTGTGAGAGESGRPLQRATYSFGSGDSHNNMPPFRVVNFIIATGKTS